MPNDGETTDGGSESDPQVVAQQEAAADERAAAEIDKDFAASQSSEGQPPTTPQPEAPGESQESDEKVAEEPKVEPEGETPPEGEPKPTLTDQEIAKARHLGMTDDEIATLTPEAAKAVAQASDRVRRREKRIGRRKKQRPKMTDPAPSSTPSAQPDGYEPPTEPEEAPEGGEVAGAPPEPEGRKPLTRLPADASPDEMIDRLNELADWTQQTDQRTSKLSESSEAQAQARQRVQMDKFFQGLKGDAVKTFGAGPIEAHRDGTPERQAREDVFDEALLRSTWYDSRDESVGVDQVMRESLAYLYPDLRTDQAPPPGEPAPTRQPRHGVARPSASRPPMRKSDESEDAQAAREIEEQARRQGIAV